MSFINLHTHTEYSILDSTIKIKDLFSRVKELNQTAVAITDHGTLAASWEAYKIAKESGVKLIIGCEFYFRHNAKDNDERFKHLILLAKNQIGYKNLLTLHAKGYDNIEQLGKKAYSCLDYSLLEDHTEGLICLTACGNGVISQLITHDKQNVEVNILKLKELFGDNLGLEVQPHYLRRTIGNSYSNTFDQQHINHQMIKLGEKYNIRVVATCDAHYLKKEDSDTHNVLLAIASGQPIYSNYRMKYDLPEFYLKTEDEVQNFFARNYPGKAKELVDNSQYFADLCEAPEWINTKYSNPSGKELPEFPVKDQPDYQEFISWENDQEEKVKKLQEDKKYLRYKCDINLKSYFEDGRLTNGSLEDYKNRITEELDVLEYRDFSSYMLVVADFLRYARTLSPFAVGPGRGCLAAGTKVLTNNGFINLENIIAGDHVYSHTGECKIVENNFVYDVNEECIEIKTRYAFDTIKLTKDHKVYGSKFINNKPSFIKASELNVGDYIWMPFIKNRDIKIWNESNKEYPVIDLANYSCEYENISNEYITQTIPLDNDLSIRSISKNSRISRNAIKDILYNSNKSRKSTISRLESYLNKSSLTLDEWKKANNTYTKKIKRFIAVDNEFYYFIGRWVGDGWIINNNGNKSYEGGVAFNSDDIDGINRIFNYLSLLGLNPIKRHAKNGTKLVQIIFRGFCFYNFLEKTFNDYKKTSKTKHFPSIFRNLCESELKSLLLGYFDSDGSVGKKSNRESFYTTSERLALELKEALLYLNIPSTIMTRQPYKRGKYNCSKSYKIRFTGFETSHIPINVLNIKNDGYYCKIIELNKTTLLKVYDIQVEDNHSYLTSNYAVHNSVGGSIIAHLIDIHKADPLKYELIFARFQNKEKLAMPDIDSDIASQYKDDVIAYLSKKYGQDHVAHVSNFNKITPKVYARDLCRALELGGSRESAIELGNKIADSIPKEIHSIKAALTEAPLFAEWAKKYPELIKYAALDGQLRANSVHAGGIVVSKRPLIGLVPYRKDVDGTTSIEYDKDRAEENGLVKIDILGLKTLDIINETYKLIKELDGSVPIVDIEGYDAKTYDLISNGNTFGVFQLGTSGGTIELCRGIKPKNILEISHINSLARPSAREIRQDFIKTKDGQRKYSLFHPSLKRSFESTFGFGLYEESLLFLAQDVAGWNLNKADGLRKLTKDKGKNPEKVKKLRLDFISDSVKHNIPEDIATRVWDETVSNFGGYGFNRSLAMANIPTYDKEGNFIETKLIQDVEKGSFVKSRDENTKEDVFVEVKDIHDHGILPVFEIELDTGEKVKCTMNHKFRVEETGNMEPLWKIIKENLSIVVK
jgi:intein/homing endonuclease